MGIQDTTRLLQRMGRSYPDRLRSNEISRHLEFESVRAVRAVRGLFEGGLITAQGSPCVEGMPGAELMLTEPGMAVAFDLAGVEADPREAIRALEAKTLSQLHRHRERRSSVASESPEDPLAAIRPSPDRRVPRWRTD